ncbi:carbohydrate ABC transporter permease [Parenemella sanctibonifatiensis]|uniref:Sugar ABC transporter permease n=1 Tax=Parenemella sanctibonifatiensis TaxID=2016505 RepID=A0A255ELH0_9ACTN|nr:sugar ABC transporter permease [Parenemella sanctibonifatiensis]OYN92379.1 sugar ABC transporter permease [Parenemella sanctibonifatiensis]
MAATPTIVTESAGAPIRRSRRPGARKAALLGMAFVLPFVVVFLLFRAGPAAGGIVLSFLSQNLAGDFTWIGTANYDALFADPIFWNALRVTLIYSVIAVPLVVVVSVAMATMAARSVRGIKVYRAAFFLPVITSLVTTGVIWTWIYSTDGPLNWFLGLFGAPAIPWISSSALVLPSLAVVAVWSRFGYDMLILMAGILDIPKDYYEAAELDGAGPWRRFVNITLPGLKRPLFFVLVLEIVASFQVFDLIYVMTGGGPVNASYSLVFMIYDQGFKYGHFGYASAAGVVLFAITVVITIIQRLFFREDD